MKVFLCIQERHGPAVHDISIENVLESNLISRVLPILMHENQQDVIVCTGECESSCHSFIDRYVYRLPASITQLLSRERDNRELLGLLFTKKRDLSPFGQLDSNICSVLAVMAYMTCAAQNHARECQASINAIAQACQSVSWTTYASYFLAFQEPMESVRTPEITEQTVWWTIAPQLSNYLRTQIFAALAHRRPRFYGCQSFGSNLSQCDLQTAKVIGGVSKIIDQKFACIAGGFAAAMAQSGTRMQDLILPTSDLDVFLLAGCPDQILSDLLRWAVHEGFTTCTKGSGVFVLVKPGVRSVQIISTNHKSPEELIASFDYGYCQAYLDVEAGTVRFSAEAARDWISGIAHPTGPDGRIRKPDRVAKALAKGFFLNDDDLEFLRSNLGEPDSDQVHELIDQVKNDRIPVDFTRWTLPRFGLIPVREPPSGWRIPVAITNVRGRDPDAANERGYQVPGDGSRIKDAFQFLHSAESYVDTVSVSDLEHTNTSGFFKLVTDHVLRCRGRLVFLGLMENIESGFYLEVSADQECLSTMRRVCELSCAKVPDPPFKAKRCKSMAREPAELDEGLFKLRLHDQTSFYENGRWTPKETAVKKLVDLNPKVEVLLRPCAASTESCVFMATTVSWALAPLFSSIL